MVMEHTPDVRLRGRSYQLPPRIALAGGGGVRVVRGRQALNFTGRTQQGKSKMGGSAFESGAGGVPGDRRYVTFLVIIALSGWTLASYDFNLLVVALPDISKDLHLTPSFVGLLGFIIYAAMFGITSLRHLFPDLPDDERSARPS